MIVRSTRAAARGASRAGFTLMEVLVVVMILVVLAGTGGVIYMNYLTGAKEFTKCTTGSIRQPWPRSRSRRRTESCPAWNPAPSWTPGERNSFMSTPGHTTPGPRNLIFIRKGRMASGRLETGKTFSRDAQRSVSRLALGRKKLWAGPEELTPYLS